MSKGDMRYVKGPFQVLHAPLTASESFVEGEPVRIADTGKLIESTDSADGGSFLGLALASGDTVGATDPIGSFRYPGLKTFSPSVLPTTNDYIPVLVPLPGCVLQGKLTTAGNMVQTVVGEPVSIDLNGGVWTFLEGAGTMLGRVIDVVDANQVPIQISGGTGAFVHVAIAVDQYTSIAADA